MTGAEGQPALRKQGAYRRGVAGCLACEDRAGADHVSSVSGGDREGPAPKRKEELRELF